jgi:hypothetical protein
MKGNEEIWKKMIEKAWVDDAFREKLIANPNKVLKEEGLHIPENVKYKIIQDKGNERNLVLPKPPQKLSGEKLRSLAAGVRTWE